MINLIKADLYRVFRSKTYKHCVIATLAIIAFGLVCSFAKISLYINLFSRGDGVQRAFHLGFKLVNSYDQLIVNALGSGAGMYIVAICLTSATVVFKMKSGIMKNTVSYGYERWKIYISQFISTVIGISILISITFLSILLITTILFKHEAIDYEGIKLAVKSLILYLSIIISVVSIYTFLATFCESSETVSAIVICEFVGSMFLEIILPSSINNFIPYSMIRAVAINPSSIDFVTYLINSLILSGVAMILGILVFNKKEIK